MRYERERSAPRRPQVVVVSAPGDPRAARLSDDLQEMGWRVILADTPEMAEDYAETAFCVVVLRARMWNAPPIAAAVRARPAVLIPVLAESMDLPRGPWTYEPIPMESPRQVVNEVADALDEAARARAGRGPGGSYPPRDASLGGGGFPRPIDRSGAIGRGGGDPFARSMPNRASVRVSVPPPPPGTAKKGGAGRGIGIVFSLLVLAGLAYGGYRYGYPYVQRHFLNTSTTAAKPVAYSANLPGPGCDTGTGKGNWQALSNSAYTGACQTGGYTLTQNSNPTQVGEIFYKDKAAFPRAYQIQVSATYTGGDGNLSVGIDVHHQADTGGGYLFSAYSDGEWHAILGANSVDKLQRLALGFLAQPAKTYKLTVDVQGPVMTFSVDGKPLGSVTDGTYPTTDAIGFFLLDYGATGAVSATFSQFSYTPEPYPALPGISILATATAQATATVKQPYSAATPGFGCDKGNGAWAPSYLLPSLSPGTTFKCDSTGMTVSQDAKNARGQVPFFGPNGILKPNDYTVSVQVAPKTYTDCGGVFTRATKDGAYGFRVCGDGSWYIYTVVKNTTTVLKNGYVAAAQSYTLAATSKGNAQSMTINGTSVGSVTDTTNTQTTYVALLIRVADGAAGSVTFTKFSFAAL